MDASEGGAGVELASFPVLRRAPVLQLGAERVGMAEAVRVAGVLVDQAYQGRNMPLRLLAPASGLVRPAAVRAYWLYHNLRVLRVLLLALLALVGFLERAPFCFDDAAACLISVEPVAGFALPRSGLPILVPALSLSLELIAFVGLWLSDPFLKLFFLRPRGWLMGWDAVKTLVIIPAVIDILVSYGVPRPWRLSPWIRVVIFCCMTQSARNAIFSFGFVWWAVWDVLLILTIFLLVFSWMGVILFSGSSAAGTYFTSFVDSLASMQIALTTANFPDVGLAAYAESPASFIYFLAFFLLGFYFLLPLILASIYSSFKTRLQAEGALFRDNRYEMLRSAYFVLQQGTGPNSPSGTVTTDDLVLMLKFLNTLVCIPYVSTTKRALVAEFLDQTKNDQITEDEFMSILVALGTKAVEKRYPSSLAYCFPNWTKTDCFAAFRRFCKRQLSWIVDVIVVADAAISIYETAVLLNVTGRPSPLSPWIQAAFVFAYVVEMVIKIAVFSPKGYWAKSLNRFDGVLTVASFIVTIIVLVPNTVTDPLIIRVFTLLRVGRLFRIFSRFKRFRLLASSLVRLQAVILRALVPVFACYYFFALLGMSIFGGLLYAENPQLESSIYLQAGYEVCSTFNDMYSSWVTLFQLMIVNNWFVISNGPELATTPSARLYFVIWWLLSVLVNVNVFVALLIDSFSQAADQGDESDDTLTETEEYELRRGRKLAEYDVK